MRILRGRWHRARRVRADAAHPSGQARSFWLR